MDVDLSNTQGIRNSLSSLTDISLPDKETILTFVRYLYLVAGLCMTFIVYGSVKSILIVRFICLILIMINCLILILLQFKMNNSDKIVNTSFLILFIIILSMYIYVLQKAGLNNEAILKDYYSNSIIFILVCVCFYFAFSYNLKFKHMDALVILFSGVMFILLWYPLLITLKYYRVTN